MAGQRWVAVVTGVVGASTFLVQPGIVGALVESGAFDASQAGIVLSADMLGIAVASTLLSTVAKEARWGFALRLAIAAVLAGNILSAFSGALEPLVIARCIAGLGYGAMITLSFVLLGQQPNQERSYGIYMAWCLTYGAVGLFGLPNAVQAVGVKGMFLAFGGLALLLLPLVGSMACAQSVESTERRTVGTRSAGVGRRSVLALFAVLCYFLAQGAAWTYLDRIGVSGGLTFEEVSEALAVCSVAGVGGALLATWQREKLGQAGPIVVGIALSICSLLAMSGSFTLMQFTVLLALFNIAWNYVHPYLLAVMARNDSNGSLVPLTVSVQTLGLAIGPAAASQLVSGNQYSFLGVVCAAFFGLAAVLMTPAALGAGSLSNAAN